MSVNLTIDQGNTAAKLALWHDEELISVTIEQCLTAESLEAFLANTEAIDAAIYCSVAQRGNQIIAVLKNHIKRVMRLDCTTDVPIVVDYATPETLGADRVAAVVGAWSQAPGEPLLVVDAGTAVTYDCLSADGHFVGGNIAPGMNMRIEALHRFTARLPRVKVPRHIHCQNFMGNDTRSAMILGAVYGILGAVSYYRSHMPEGTRVVMTGGWASELGRLADFEITVDPHLVSRGLNRILIHNENN